MGASGGLVPMAPGSEASRTARCPRVLLPGWPRGVREERGRSGTGRLSGRPPPGWSSASPGKPAGAPPQSSSVRDYRTGLLEPWLRYVAYPWTIRALGRGKRSRNLPYASQFIDRFWDLRFSHLNHTRRTSSRRRLSASKFPVTPK